LQTITYQLLSGICLLPAAADNKVLRAVTAAQKSLGERARFQKLLDHLWTAQGDASPTRTKLHIAIMSFVNALLNSGVAQVCEQRMGLVKQRL
jgi:hypothetical protein